jgi:ribose transport system permease protein
MKIMDGSNAMIVPGLAIALGCGAGVGVFNYGLIRLLRIPPIIATLSSSFLFLSAAISYSRGLRIKPPPLLADFTTWILWGIPLLAVAGMVITFVMSVILNRTVFGRTVTAIGQNARAARLAGLPVDRVRFATYVMCGMFAGLTGYLVSGFAGGAALNMGAEYLLASIAVVVIGGTSVAGGFANLPGLWGAAMLLFLLVTMLNTYGFGAGIRMVLTGMIIIAVITIASGRKPSG